MFKEFKKKDLKKVLCLVLVMVVFLADINYPVHSVNADETMTTIYLVDNTNEAWIGNDSAEIQLVDNTHGHNIYWMTKKDNHTWSVNVPSSAYNITFNRFDSGKTTQWNSWSAGGRDSNNAYFVDGTEYGHWDYIEDEKQENYFHAGDVVYLDLRDFTAWENDDAIMYANFSDAYKEENNSNDISISSADKNIYNPKVVNWKIKEHIYAYVVSKSDEGKDVIRFWRGNVGNLWNCSDKLTYEDYKNGINCIKIHGWNNLSFKMESPYSIDYDVDSDGDGLTDYYEYIFESDINSKDTDNDGLSDYEECIILGTNPLCTDTDANGIPDALEDADEDGLLNGEECLYNTSNCTVDSDGDTISDYDEIHIYNTNPLSKDTDNDGASDAWEIENGHNPIVFDEKFSITQTESGNDTSIQIDLTAKGEYIESFSCSAHENDYIFINQLIPGYLGSGYDFSIEGEFDNATIKYTFNECYLEDGSFNPVVYYYNEETNELEEIQTEWDGEHNYVTAELEHFSTYLLLNKTKFEEVWNNEIKPPVNENESTNLNVSFVVDVSGSMRGNKIATTKVAIKSFLDILEDEDLASLITFNSQATLLCDLTSDKQKINEKINSMYADGYTAIYKGIDKAVNILAQDNIKGYKMVIVFTDGYDEPATTYDMYYKDIVDRAKNNNIVIYTIGISTIDEQLLKRISQETCGNYYYASVITELQDKIDSIKEETIDYTTDSNNDGITDYYTKLICNGKLRTTTNSVITGWIGNYEEVQKNSDFDGDGLLNSAEIEIIIRNGSPCIKVLSDPANEDTDNDGISDYQEKNRGTDPFKYNVSAIHIDGILNNDLYVASIFSDEYVNNGQVRLQLGIGNFIGSGKITYVNDYKRALLEYIKIYNEDIYTDIKFKQLRDLYGSKINEIFLDIVNYQINLGSVAGDASELARASEILNSSKDAIKSLEKTLSTITEYSKLQGFDDELIMTYNNIYVQLLEQKSKSSVMSEVLKNVNLDGKLAEGLGNFANKLPSEVWYAINKYGNAISYGLIILDTGMNIANTLDLYASMNTGLIQYTEIYNYLDEIVCNSNISELVNAANDVKYALSDDFSKCISEIGMVSGNIGEGATSLAYYMALAEAGPLGWAISIGGCLGNLIFKTGSVDKELLKVIAYGDSASSYSKRCSYKLKKDTDIYYYVDDIYDLGTIQLLGQLRVVGEDQYAYSASKRGGIIKFIGSIQGCSQKEIEEYCSDTIDDIIRRCNIYNIEINKFFEGAYLNN